MSSRKIKVKKEKGKTIKSKFEKEETIKAKSEKVSIKYDFRYFKFRSVKLNKVFTNYMLETTEAYKIVNKLFEELPRGYMAEILSKKHNHFIKDDSKIKTIEKISKELKITFEKDEMSEYHQIAFTNGLRMVGFKTGIVFYPLFLDPHHLIYPSEKHNGDDSKHFKVCIFGNQ